MKFPFLTALILTAIIAKPAAAAGPNILLILADDLGYGDVACYNPQSKVPTPHIDHLATQSMRFTDAHSPSTVCTPTRYSLMTGRMAFRTGKRGVFTGAGGPCMIEPSRLTLPAMLRNVGYDTAMFGKWHIGMTFYDSAGAPINEDGLAAVKRIDYARPITGGPTQRGFNHFFGTASCPTTDWLYAYIDHDRIPVPPTNIVDKTNLPKHEYSRDNRPGMIAPNFDLQEVDAVFLDKSIAYLESHAKNSPDQPFFLFHSAQAVHQPSFPGRAFKGKTNVGPHGDFIFQFDHIVGELMATLKRLNLADNTLVIVTSDNGPETGPIIGMRRDYNHDGAAPWRGVKRDQWEGGHRVPLIVRWPNVIHPNSTQNQTVNLTDIMATCAAITQADLPNNAAEDSINILPLLLNPNHPTTIHEYTLHQTITLDLAIRKGPWKYLDHKGSGGNNYATKLKQFALPEFAPTAPAQLYNLDNDPGETTNLYHQYPDLVRQLKSQLDQYVAAGRSAPQRP